MPVSLPPVEGIRDRFQRLPAAAQAILILLGVVAVAAFPSLDHIRGADALIFKNVLMTIMVQVVIFAIAALGLNIVTGYTGQLNLGFVAFAAIGAYTTGVLMRDGLPGEGGFPRGPWPFWAAIPVAVLHAGIWGVLLGLPILRLTGDYFAVVTFGFAELTALTARNWDSLTGGAQGLKNVPWATIGDIKFGSSIGGMAPIWVLSVLMLATAYVLTWRILKSRVGLAWRAIREDEIAAQSCGIDLRLYKSLAFFVSAALGGLAGSLFPLLFAGVFVSQFAFTFSVFILAYVVFGGMGSIAGSLSGAALLLAVVEGLRYGIDSYNASSSGADINPELRFMVYGVLLILMVRFRPEGIFPSRRVQGEMHPENARVVDQMNAGLYEVTHRRENVLR